MSSQRPLQVDPLRQFDPRDTARLCDLLSFGRREDTLDAIELLLTGKADPNAQDPNTGSRPLHSLARLPIDDARALAQTLVDAGADVNARDLKGRSPLMIASRKPEPALCQLFLDLGADPNSIDAGINSPLSYAAFFNSQAVVGALLAGGADPSFPNASGVSFIRLCSEGRVSEGVVSAWTQSEASKAPSLDVDARLEGASLLDTATRSGQTNMARWLLDRGANPLAGELEQSVADALAQGHRECAHVALEALQKAQFAPTNPAPKPQPSSAPKRAAP